MHFVITMTQKQMICTTMWKEKKELSGLDIFGCWVCEQELDIVYDNIRLASFLDINFVVCQISFISGHIHR